MKKDLLDEADWDEELATTVGSRRSKRRKTVTISARRTSICTPPVEGPRPDLRLAEFQVDVIDFDDILYSELTEWAEERIKALQKVARSDGEGTRVRAITRADAQDLLFEQASLATESSTLSLVKRKLERTEGRARLDAVHTYSQEVHSLAVTQESHPPNEVLAALRSIRCTPFERSFLSRLHGCLDPEPKPVLFVDWDTQSPWMDLMEDVRDHYLLSHLDVEPYSKPRAAITYVALRQEHLDQVHDLLARTFWAGINVSDALAYEPEKCTVIAMYKRLVVGVALLSEPQHAYMTYLAVRAGWENAHIATTMLYYLIHLNPGRHITLHVSANNSAMLLYNRFGFKAEKFIVGFYDAYLPPDARASKNAFFLRLRP